MEVNWLDLIDAAYRMDGEDGAWLSSVMAAANPMMSRDLGTVGVLYDVSEAGTFRVEHAIRGQGSLEVPPGTYRVWASRGSEYELVERTVQAASGAHRT